GPAASARSRGYTRLKVSALRTVTIFVCAVWAPGDRMSRNSSKRTCIEIRRSRRGPLANFGRIMRRIKFAGAGFACECDQMLGNDAGGDDFLDSALLQAWPGIAPERLAVVGQHAELPAHLKQHGEAPFQVLESELAGPRRALAPMRIGAVNLVV